MPGIGQAAYDAIIGKKPVVKRTTTTAKAKAKPVPEVELPKGRPSALAKAAGMPSAQEPAVKATLAKARGLTRPRVTPAASSAATKLRAKLGQYFPKGTPTATIAAAIVANPAIELAARALGLGKEVDTLKAFGTADKEADAKRDEVAGEMGNLAHRVAVAKAEYERLKAEARLAELGR